MSKKLIALAALLAVITIGIVLLVRSGGDVIKEKPLAEKLEDKRKVQAEKLAELAQKRGGLPIDQALNQADSERHRDFIKKDMAYQKQTREEALKDAREKLNNIEKQIAAVSDDKDELARLERIKMLVEKTIRNLE